MGQHFSKLAESLSQNPLFSKLIALFKKLIKILNYIIKQLPFYVVSGGTKLLPPLFPTPKSRLIGVHALNISIRSLLPLSTAYTAYLLYRWCRHDPLCIRVPEDIPPFVRYLDYFIMIWNPIEIAFYIYECYIANQLQELSKPKEPSKEERDEIQHKLMHAIHYLYDYIPRQQLEEHLKHQCTLPKNTSTTSLTQSLNDTQSYQNQVTSIHVQNDNTAAPEGADVDKSLTSGASRIHNRIVHLSDSRELVEIEWDVRRYLQGWFLHCPLESIQYENIVDFICTTTLLKKAHECTPGEMQEVYQNVNELIRGPESCRRTDMYIQPGFNSSIRLINPPYDKIDWLHRPALIYGGIAVIHKGTEFLLQSMGYTKHIMVMNNGKELKFWHRKGKYSHDDEDDEVENEIDMDDINNTPIVFCHGIGLGLTPYLNVIRQLPFVNQYCSNANASSKAKKRRVMIEREVFLLEFEHVSMKRTHRIPTEEETAHAVVLMLSLKSGQKHHRRTPVSPHIHTEEHTCRPAVFIGHSYGTLSLAWFVKYHPSMIARLVFIDPICFLLFTYELSYKFFHRPLTTALHHIMDYWVARELYIGNTLTRNMRWTESTCFKEDLLTLKRRTPTSYAEVKYISTCVNPSKAPYMESLPPSYPQPIVVASPSAPPPLKRDDSSAYSATITGWSESESEDESEDGNQNLSEVDRKIKKQKNRNNIRRTSSFAIGHSHRTDTTPARDDASRARQSQAPASLSTPPPHTQHVNQEGASGRGVMTYVFLSENDAIVGSQSIYNYLTSSFNDPDVKSEGNKIVVEWMKNFQHAQFLFSQEAQTMVLKSIVD